MVEADVPGRDSDTILEEMRALDGTIRARLLHARD